MNKRIRKGIVGALALAMATGAGPFAFAKDSKAPSGAMNLRLQGSEIFGSTPAQYSILAIGQELVTTEGAISGDETFTYVEPGSTSTGVCGGDVSGTIGYEGDPFGTLGKGQFDIALTFIPSEGGAPGSGTICDTTVYDLLCNRTLVHKNLANDLNAGQYHCVVTKVMVGGASETPVVAPSSLEGHLDIVSGSNSPQS